MCADPFVTLLVWPTCQRVCVCVDDSVNGPFFRSTVQAFLPTARQTPSLAPMHFVALQEDTAHSAARRNEPRHDALPTSHFSHRDQVLFPPALSRCVHPALSAKMASLTGLKQSVGVRSAVSRRSVKVRAAASRPLWLPDMKAPAHLNGTLPGAELSGQCSMVQWF